MGPHPPLSEIVQGSLAPRAIGHRESTDKFCQLAMPKEGGGLSVPLGAGG